MYEDTVIFSIDLISTYQAIIELIKINGDSGIINKKRKDTYNKAIQIVKDLDTSIDISVFINKLSSILTEKPKKLMNELYNDEYVILEDKLPYNGAMIKNGKIVGVEDEIEAFENLSVLVGIGIGIGDIGVKELVQMGYNSIDKLRIVYEENKFVNFRKGLQKPLCKYFEGTVRIEKMSRDEATKWMNTLSALVDKEANEETSDVIIMHKIAGSYARKKTEIGDIDYLIVVNGEDNTNIVLYNIMNRILDSIVKVDNIGNLPVELDSVVETPSRSIKDKRYSTSIKLWFKVRKLKTKIEIYGYTNTEFIFPYFARSAEVNLQKKVKIHASRKGYKLSPWGLDIKDTDISIENIPDQVELIKKKIGKDKIETIKDLFNFLEYK